VPRQTDTETCLHTQTQRHVYTHRHRDMSTHTDTWTAFEQVMWKALPAGLETTGAGLEGRRKTKSAAVDFQLNLQISGLI